jgi:coenzyme F420-0:L-glutamate ligase/coenzyme F420-1:gamma-L-glutamate ligase
MSTQIVMTALPGMPRVVEGDDLGEMIAAAAERCGHALVDGDIVALAQKIVSKAEGRMVDLAGIAPSEAARDLATLCDKDPRQMQLVLAEATTVVRARRGVVIVALRNGMVLANAGIDRSNVDAENEDHVLLLPAEPDASAAAIRERVERITGARVGVIIVDSIGRAWRLGTVGTAIGASGVRCLTDLRGSPDMNGRPLQTTDVGTADELAAAASMLMGQAAEGTPVVLIRGAAAALGDGRAADLVRPVEMDLFR